VKLIIIVLYRPLREIKDMYIAAEDIEAGSRTKFQIDPTLPIYLKVINNIHILHVMKYTFFHLQYSCT